MTEFVEDTKEQVTDYEPIPEALLHDWITRLKGDETGTEIDGIARAVIYNFYLSVSRGEHPHRYISEWLAEVLSDVLDKGKPDARKAFSLLPLREGRTSEADQHLDISIWIRLTKERGYSRPQAIKKAAAVFHKDEKTIRRILKANNDGKNWNINPDVWEELFKQKRRPLPVRNRRGTTTK